jgi:hypothetical protein
MLNTWACSQSTLLNRPRGPALVCSPATRALAVLAAARSPLPCTRPARPTACRPCAVLGWASPAMRRALAPTAAAVPAPSRTQLAGLDGPPVQRLRRAASLEDLCALASQILSNWRIAFSALLQIFWEDLLQIRQIQDF